MDRSDIALTFIGLGEAASAFITGWEEGFPGRISAYDIKLQSEDGKKEISGRANALGVRCCATIAEALDGADFIFSTVTADQAVAAARAAAPLLPTDATWCDLNSCAPSSKRTSAKLIEKSNSRYLDIAVMASVHPRMNMTPCLISGPDAGSVAVILRQWPMEVRVVGSEVGRASSVKMVRSIMVKGMEALTAECTIAAVVAGVADEVLPSLKSGHPYIDVAKYAAYNFERSIRHGERRAAELDEVALTLADLGLPNTMSKSTAEWQRRLAGEIAKIPEPSSEDDYETFVRTLLPRISKP